jgi:hypothetical protein
MKRPGDRLRALATYLCDAQTVERVIDPAIADLQCEPPSLAGYVAVVKVVAIVGARIAMKTSWTPPADERLIFRQTLGRALLMLLLLTMALALPPYFQSGDSRPTLLLALTLVPQALAVSVPMALMLGIALGVGGRASSRRLWLALALLALVCSIGSFLNLGWLTPAANQEFRVEMFRAVAPGPPAPERDDSELTLGELRRAITQPALASLRPGGYEWTSVNRRRLGYHTRWSLSFATIALVVPLLAFTVQRQRSRLVLGMAVVCGWLGYYTLLYFSRQSALNGELPVVVGAWLPNVVLFLVAAGLKACTTTEVRLKADATY